MATSTPKDPPPGKDHDAVNAEDTFLQYAHTPADDLNGTFEYESELEGGILGAVGSSRPATLEVSSTASTATVLDRMHAAGIDDERARNFIRTGWVRVDGSIVITADYPAAPPARVVIQPPPPDHGRS